MKYLFQVALSSFFNRSPLSIHGDVPHARGDTSAIQAPAQKTKNISIRNVRSMVVWGSICLVMTAGLWVFTWIKLDEEYTRVTKEALKDASYLSQAYSDQLARSIDQIDQIALYIGHEWHHSKKTQQAHAAPNLFAAGSHLQMWIADRKGNLVAAPKTQQIGQNVADEIYFQRHFSGQIQELLIGNPTQGHLAENSVIHFSRPLKAADGSFDGVVVIAAETGYLRSFTNELSLGKNNSFSLKRIDGTPLVSKRGDNVGSVATIYKTPSVFSTDMGAVRMSADHFVDDKARVVAWSKLKNYPLMAIVNLSEKDIFKNMR